MTKAESDVLSCRWGLRLDGIFLEGPFFTEKYKGTNLSHDDPSLLKISQMA